MGTCCGCLALRTGVALFASLVLCQSLGALATLVTEDVRELVGGYGFLSNLAILALGLLGVSFSLVGVVGCSDNTSGWVRAFAHFVVCIKLPVGLVITITDLTVMQSCERLSAFGGAYTSLSGNYYNVALESAALAGNCGFSRRVYAVVSLISLIVCLYGARATYLWCDLVDHDPRYQIALDEARPLRIYTGYKYPPVLRSEEWALQCNTMEQGPPLLQEGRL